MGVKGQHGGIWHWRFWLAFLSRTSPSAGNSDPHSPIKPPPIKHAPHRCIGDNDGSVIVEFAVVAPIFFLIVFAALQLAIALYAKTEFTGLSFRISHQCIAHSVDTHRMCNEDDIIALLNKSVPGILADNIVRGGRESGKFTTADIKKIPIPNAEGRMFEMRMQWNMAIGIATSEMGIRALTFSANILVPPMAKR